MSTYRVGYIYGSTVGLFHARFPDVRPPIWATYSEYLKATNSTPQYGDLIDCDIHGILGLHPEYTDGN